MPHSRDFLDDSRLVQLWTEQLYREYEQVLYTYRAPLRKAVVRIAELESRWGEWHPEYRTITINRRLIREYPWDIVIEVLKHEMAHQWVSERHPAGMRPHGAEFVSACRRLGVAEWAVSASGELPREALGFNATRATSAEEERLLARVEKLLALAGSSNEHEALLAMQRVQEMYAKYNLERVRRNAQGGMVYRLINRRKKRIDAVQSMIGAILAEHFFVKVIYSRLYDAEELTQHAVMELLGTQENVLMAEYVHGFLTQQTESLWQSYRRREGRRGLRGRRSHSLGVLTGFNEKLRALQAAPLPEIALSEAKALMRVADQALEAYVGERHPRLTTRSWGGGSRESGAYEAGVSEGRSLNLHRPIREGQGNLGRLLGK